MSKPQLTVLVGLPGSGKSTFAKKQNVAVVTVDDFLRAAGKGKNPTAADNLAARAKALALVVEKLKAGKPVIYDHTNLNGEIRAEVFRAVKSAGLKVPIVAQVLATDFFSCVAQNHGREFGLNPLNIFYLALALAIPTKKEGFAKVEIVRAIKPPPPSPSLSKFLAAPTLKNLEPEKLRQEILELELLAAALTKMGEDWAAELPTNFATLTENCAENNLRLSAELAAAWLYKDLFRLITEYFAVSHPDTPLPREVNLNELIFERILKLRLSTYDLDLPTVKSLLTGYFAVAERGATPPRGQTEKLLAVLLVA